MPKKPSLLDAAKSLPRSRGGQHTFSEGLSPEHRKEFDEFLVWYANSPKDERPTFAAIRLLLKERLGRAPAESTFRKLVANAK